MKSTIKTSILLLLAAVIVGCRQPPEGYRVFANGDRQAFKWSESDGRVRLACSHYPKKLGQYIAVELTARSIEVRSLTPSGRTCAFWTTETGWENRTYLDGVGRAEWRYPTRVVVVVESGEIEVRRIQ